MNINSPVINKQSLRSITPPWIKISPNYSVFKARFNAVKKRAPKGATNATKAVMVNKCICKGDEKNWYSPRGPNCQCISFY